MADDLNSLARDLGEVPKATAPFIRKAIEVTARHVKDDWKKNATGASHLFPAPPSVTYDMKGGEGIRGGSVEAEVGPEKGRKQSRFLGIVEDGAPTTPPKKYGQRALDSNVEDFEQGIQRAIDDGLKAAGL